jgi:hypothetical protein
MMASIKDLARALNEAQYSFGNDEVEKAFDLLEKALKRNKLVANLRTGEKRTAKPSEFQLMGKDGTDYQFKHKESRNYVLVNERTGGLAAPKTDKPFFKGELYLFTSSNIFHTSGVTTLRSESFSGTRRMERGFKRDDPRVTRPNARHVIDMAQKIISALEE